MPATLYLTTGDEITVTASYATALDVLHADSGDLAEFTAVWWTHVTGDFEEREDWPAYREHQITVRTDNVVAVERIEGKHAQAIDRAREHFSE